MHHRRGKLKKKSRGGITLLRRNFGALKNSLGKENNRQNASKAGKRKRSELGFTERVGKKGLFRNKRITRASEMPHLTVRRKKPVIHQI